MISAEAKSHLLHVKLKMIPVLLSWQICDTFSPCELYGL